jgi:ATP-dependent 26S proteasome regulatory subunit
MEIGNVSFIKMVGSEFVQKYLGEGPRMVRDVFRMAKENSPSIIFIDEVDAIATKRSVVTSFSLPTLFTLLLLPR